MPNGCDHPIDLCVGDLRIHGRAEGGIFQINVNVTQPPAPEGIPEKEINDLLLRRVLRLERVGAST